MLPTDEDLYARVKRSGDLAAFDALYERHKAGLFRFIARYLSDAGDIEDVFHEAFLRALKPRSGPGSCDDEVDFSQGTFRGWLYMIARNVCLNRERSARRARRAFAALTQGPPWESPSAESLLGEQVELERLRRAAGEMPPPLAEVFRLKMQGRDHGEISRGLGIPVGTVKSRLHAILKFLKSEMKA